MTDYDVTESRVLLYCLTCGWPYDEHRATCPRHEHMPATIALARGYGQAAEPGWVEWTFDWIEFSEIHMTEGVERVASGYGLAAWTEFMPFVLLCRKCGREPNCFCVSSKKEAQEQGWVEIKCVPLDMIANWHGVCPECAKDRQIGHVLNMTLVGIPTKGLTSDTTS